MSSGWKVLGSESFCDFPWLKVAREHVATPTRPDGVHWMVAHRPVAAVVAPRTPEGSYLLIRQERIPVRRETWEFPAGQVESVISEQSIVATAHRELGEEAGVRCPGELVSLGHFYSSVGFTDECCHLFLASDVVQSADLVDHDEHEAIHEVRAFSPDELTAAVAEGTIIDANTMAVYARLNARGCYR